MQKLRQEILNIMNNHPVFIVFDTETTGLNANRNKILQVAAIKMAFNEETGEYEEIDRLDQYIRPQGKIPASIEELTGITNDFIKNHPKEKIAFPIIQLFFEDCDLFVGHNLAFDIRFMKEMYIRNDEIFPEKQVIDTCKLAKDIIPKDDIENHKLCTVSAYLGIDKDPEIRFHSAIGDVLATSKMFLSFIKTYKMGKKISETITVYPQKEKEKEFPSTPANFIIDSMHFWKCDFSAFAGIKRIYIRIHTLGENPAYGTVFYDLGKKKFLEKDCTLLSFLSEEILERECYKIARSLSYKDLQSFKGNYTRRNSFS